MFSNILSAGFDRLSNAACRQRKILAILKMQSWCWCCWQWQPQWQLTQLAVHCVNSYLLSCFIGVLNIYEQRDREIFQKKRSSKECQTKSSLQIFFMYTFLGEKLFHETIQSKYHNLSIMNGESITIMHPMINLYNHIIIIRIIQLRIYFFQGFFSKLQCQNSSLLADAEIQHT